jgi:hypothetical protein
MNPIPDNTAATLRHWTTELTTGLTAAGLMVDYASHKGHSSSVRLGRLTATKPGTGINYTVDFERKLIIKNDERCFITQIEVYNPLGKLHVHIRNCTPATVVKIVDYAKQTIENKIARAQADMDNDRRNTEGYAFLQREFTGFTVPSWASVRPVTDSDANVGKFRVTFNAHRIEWPLACVTPERAKSAITAIESTNLPEPAPVSAWRPASVPVPPALVNEPGSVTGITKMLLLCVERHDTPVRGWYYGGLLNEFRMEGSPQAVYPTHWMPLPDKASANADMLSVGGLVSQFTHEGRRVKARGKCEKCGMKTNWVVDVNGRTAYWCGCGD